jgi:hypothetical protein
VIRFPAARVDSAIRDGETVTLGGTTLTAVATPRHTPGCATWTLTAIERRRLKIVFPCSISVASNILVGSRRYPSIVADYCKSFARLARSHRYRAAGASRTRRRARTPQAPGELCRAGPACRDDTEGARHIRRRSRQAAAADRQMTTL